MQPPSGANRSMSSGLPAGRSLSGWLGHASVRTGEITPSSSRWSRMAAQVFRQRERRWSALPTMIMPWRARDSITFTRFSSARNPMERPRDRVIDMTTTFASSPWKLSTVATRTLALSAVRRRRANLACPPPPGAESPAASSGPSPRSSPGSSTGVLSSSDRPARSSSSLSLSEISSRCVCRSIVISSLSWPTYGVSTTTCGRPCSSLSA